MKRKPLWLFLLVIGLVLASVPAAFGQVRTGTITGTVADESGGVLPGADVAIINQATQDTRRTVTSEEGFFSVVALPAATYTLEVEMPGFTLWRRTDIRLESAARLNIVDIALAVAGVGTEVTVSSASEQISPVDSGEKSATLSSDQIEDIPIIGRNAAELLRVLPGMTPTSDPLTNNPTFSGEVMGINGNGAGGQQSPIGNYSANGTRTAQLNIVFDGGNVSDPGCNCATPVNPNPDMIAEFKVLTSNYGAEHAKGPVVIDAVSKSGSSEFHGTGYFHLRHWKLNSNEWELNRIGADDDNDGKADRVKNKFYFPGFNVGGPLTPGRDKLFFFVGMEWMKQTLDTGLLRAVVPTAANLQGDWSESEVSGLTAGSDRGLNTVPSGFENGQIPSSQWDPGGLSMLNLYPAANIDPAVGRGFNYTATAELDQPNDQFLVRVDYSISDNAKLFARYNRQRETQPFVTTLWWRPGNGVPYPSRVLGENRSDAISTSLTNVFSPTVTNEALFTLTFVGFPNVFEDGDAVNRANTGYPYKGLYKNGVQQIPTLTSWGGGLGEIVNPYLHSDTLDPADANLFADKWMVSASDNFVKIMNTHTLKAGFFWEWVNNDQFANPNANGQMVPNPWHGLSSGNALADVMLGNVADYNEANFPAHHNMAYHTWDLYIQSPRLTLDAGLRLTHLGAWSDISASKTGMAVWAPDTYDDSLSLEDNFNELTGVLWNAKDPNTPKSGADPKFFYFQPRFGAAYDVSGDGNTVLRGGIGWFRFHDTQQPMASTMALAQGQRDTTVGGGLNLADIEALDVVTEARFGLTTLRQGDEEQARTISYSFTIQQRIPFQHMIEIGYVGNRQNYMISNGGNWENRNFIPLGTMLDLEDPDSGDANLFRPLELYGTINVKDHNIKSNYNGLQFLLSRNAGSLSYMMSYTWSKAMGYRGAGWSGGQCGAADPEACYGPIGSDRSHVFNISYSWQVPGYTGDNGFARAALDGWQVTGISNYVSGGPLQSSNSNFGFDGSDAQGQNLSNRNWLGTPDVQLQPTLLCDPRDGVSGDVFINPACFGISERGVNGDSMFPYIKGPSYHNHDLSIFKNFSFTEDKRLQVRFSAYNFLNHPLKRLEGENLNMTFDNGVQSNSRFGRYDDDARKVGRRIIQLGFKFFF
jgi:hypothetical protein